MKLSTVAFLLPFLARADADARKAQDPKAPFDVMAVDKGPLQYHALATSSSFFYIGGQSETTSYCPPDVQKKNGCPPGKDTVFKDANALDVAVPGGQQLYVDSKWNVRLSGPDGSGMDPGSITGGFKYYPGDRHGEWTYDADGIKGLMACPYNYARNGIYQVLVNTSDAKPPSGESNECVPFTAGAFEYGNPQNRNGSALGAWAY